MPEILTAGATRVSKDKKIVKGIKRKREREKEREREKKDKEENKKEKWKRSENKTTKKTDEMQGIWRIDAFLSNELI